SSEPQAVSSTFERIQSQVFTVSCSSESCHSSVGRAADLVLEEGYAWDSLVDHDPTNPVAAANGMMRVMAGDPDRSFILAKLTDDLDPGEGDPMPWNAARLEPGTIEIIEAWIRAGAPAVGRVPGDDGRPLNGGGEDPNELVLPPPARGIQIAVTAPAIEPGTEETLCHYMKLPSDVDLDVNRFEIAVSGGSHHIHLYRAVDAELDLPDGVEVCNMAVDFDMWSLVVAAQLRHTDWQLPDGVAYHLRAGEQVLVQTHFVNVGSLETRGEGRVKMNLHDAPRGSVEHFAGTLFGQDRDVFVPARSNPTQYADCVFPQPITLMAQTGHYHFRGRRFSSYVLDSEGNQGAEIYHHEGYDDPKFEVYDAAPPMFAAGEGLRWECYWENPYDIDFHFGPFTDTNEHCNLFGFYYPAATPGEAMACVKQDGVSLTTVRAQQ
ncbi:MAG TPA: hypothetical protein VEB21_03725, partial [Terriglobales bacterium]|nr:hypothetical protein [Terriglobales bacterium]